MDVAAGGSPAVLLRCCQVSRSCETALADGKRRNFNDLADPAQAAPGCVRNPPRAVGTGGRAIGGGYGAASGACRAGIAATQQYRPEFGFRCRFHIVTLLKTEQFIDDRHTIAHFTADIRANSVLGTCGLPGPAARFGSYS